MTKPIAEQIADLKRAIAAQEGLGPTLGDAVVDTMIAAAQDPREAAGPQETEQAQEPDQPASEA